MTSVSGTSIPLSSVLSPVSLAACTRVDSVFSPHFIPLFSVTANCELLQVTLLHRAERLSGGSVSYDGYQIASSNRSQEAEELFRISLGNGRLFLRQMREASTLVKVCSILYYRFAYKLVHYVLMKLYQITLILILL